MNGKTQWIAVLAGAAVAVSGCQGAIVGNVVALGIAAGLFVGTLQLGRTAQRRPEPRSSAIESIDQRPG